jgi:hypothetical protein
MQDAMGYIILALVVAWAAFVIRQGNTQENAPPLTMADNGHGMNVPVCSQCRAGLVTLNRTADNPLIKLVAVAFGVGGIAAMLFFNIIAGMVALILSVILNYASKSKQTVLTCPACGKDARILQ